MAADRPSDHSRRRRRGQRGETLLEALLAIGILAIVAVVAYAGLRTSIASSSQHRESAEAETVLRTAAERLQDPTLAYVDWAGCPGRSSYTGLPARPGYSIVQTVEFAAPGGTTFGPCPAGAGATDPGLQRITLRITSPSGHAHELEVLRRRPVAVAP